MKRKIVWKRLLILAAAACGVCLLGIAALFTVGRSLLSTIRASMWTADPALARQSARAMLDYQLPEGFSEAKVLKIQNVVYEVIITGQQHPGDMIFLQTIQDEIRENESWRTRYEEGWSKDLDGHRYQVSTVAVRQIQIGGTSIPLRLLEGTNESGQPVKQAVCILPGKTGDVLVAVMSSSDSWNLNLVETFYRSIQ